MCKLSDKLLQKIKLAGEKKRKKNEDEKNGYIKTTWLNTKSACMRIFYAQIIRFIWYIELCVRQISRIKHENAQADTLRAQHT